MDVAYYRAPKKRKFLSTAKKIFLWLFLLIVVIALGYGVFFASKFYSVTKKITINSEEPSSLLETFKSLATGQEINLKNFGGRINILLLGMAGKGKPGQYLTDTIMIASLNLKTYQVALLSIPRDLFVPVPDMDWQAKINTLYNSGLSDSSGDRQQAAESVSQAVENITGLEINYFLALNFAGFEKIIDSLGGINITNEYDIYDASYPGPNYSYEIFELPKGFHHLDGATALKYARERHDRQGDFGRAKRQQQVMQAAKNKIFSAGTWLNPLSANSLLDSLGDNLITNVSSKEIGDFIELAKKLDTQNINNMVLDAWNKESLLKVSHIFSNSGVRAFILVPRVGNWSEVRELAANIFDLNQIKRRKEEISKEKAGVAIINKTGDPLIAEKIKKLLSERFDYKSVFILNDLVRPTENVGQKTVAYDLTNGKKPFTLDEIATRLPASVSYAIPDSIKKTITNTTVDIVIIIGKDLIERYNMEEDTIEDLNNARDNEEQQIINSNK